MYANRFSHSKKKPGSILRIYTTYFAIFLVLIFIALNGRFPPNENLLANSIKISPDTPFKIDKQC